MGEQIVDTLNSLLRYVLMLYKADGVYLFAGIVIAVALSVYIDPEKIKKFLINNTGFSIWGGVAFGAFTPLCACGTMAVIISMTVSALPWGAIMAFLVSSPLMSPDIFVFYAGIVGLHFAVALTVASIVLGFGAGYITHFIEKYTGFLKNQLHYDKTGEPSDCCCNSVTIEKEAPLEEDISDILSFHSPMEKMKTDVNDTDIMDVLRFEQYRERMRNRSFYTHAVEDFFFGCCEETAAKGIEKPTSFWEKIKGKLFLLEFYKLGIKRILPYFTGFAVIAFLVETYIPTQKIIMSLYDKTDYFAIPIMALVGFPLYVSGASALPLLLTLIKSGATYGSILAFLITGTGTSLAVIIGLLIIMKRKAIVLYIMFIFLGAVLSGYAYDFILQWIGK